MAVNANDNGLDRRDNRSDGSGGGGGGEWGGGGRVGGGGGGWGGGGRIGGGGGGVCGGIVEGYIVLVAMVVSGISSDGFIGGVEMLLSLFNG